MLLLVSPLWPTSTFKIIRLLGRVGASSTRKTELRGVLPVSEEPSWSRTGPQSKAIHACSHSTPRRVSTSTPLRALLVEPRCLLEAISTSRPVCALETSSDATPLWDAVEGLEVVSTDSVLVHNEPFGLLIYFFFQTLGDHLPLI